MQTTRWHTLDGHWDGFQLHPCPNGKQLVLVLNDHDRGMQVELWDNPMVSRMIPRGLPTGVVVGLISFILLQLLSRWRASRIGKSSSLSASRRG